jgi:hypothetical protein
MVLVVMPLRDTQKPGKWPPHKVFWDFAQFGTRSIFT